MTPSEITKIYGEVLYEAAHEDGFIDAIEEQANVNILEDAGWRLVKLIVERINDGPSGDNLLEEAIEDTFEEFMSAADEEGAEEDAFEDESDEEDYGL